MAGAAAAAAEPNFGAVMDSLENDSPLKNWVVQFRTKLQADYEENLRVTQDRQESLEPFQPERALVALRRVAFRQNGVIRKRFERPCCKKKPFTWPFCNPDC